MNAEEFLQDLAKEIQTRTDLDEEVRKEVVSRLLMIPRPAGGIDGLELALHTIAMRRAETK